MAQLEEDRFSQEVSSLSTKLVTAVARQSELEEQIVLYKRELDYTKKRNSTLIPIEDRFKDLSTSHDAIISENQALKARIELLTKMKDDAEEECRNLRSETEELGASLFGEANTMVSDARRETYNYKIKNEKLSEQLTEKDTIITNLQDQLKELKQILQNLDDEQKLQSQPPSVPSTPLMGRHSSISVESFGASPLTENLKERLNQQQLQQYIYSPMLKALRYDLNSYSEFKEFIRVISRSYFPMDLPALRELRYFKKVLLEDIDPALRLDLAPGVSYFNRKSFLNNIVEGRAIVEPISGVNETYRLNFQKESNNGSSTSLTNTNLVKTNLYSYPKDSPPVATHDPCSLCGESRDDILEHSRLYTLKVLPPAIITGTNNLTPKKHSYALCNYCLFRVRNVCEFFAKLRSIHNGVYKIANDLDYKKIYSILATAKAKIFWSRIGIWDINENVVEYNGDDLNSSIFDITPSKNVDNSASHLRSQPQEINHVKYKNDSTTDLNSTTDVISQIDSINNESIIDSKLNKSSSEEVFEDTTEIIEEKNLKSKSDDKFKEKLNTDLDETMAMIENMKHDDFEAEVDNNPSVKKAIRKKPTEVIEINSDSENENESTIRMNDRPNKDKKEAVNKLISKFEN